MTFRPLPWIASLLVVGAVVGLGAYLAWWKAGAMARSEAAAQSQPEMPESVLAATARRRTWQRTTTAVGTVKALRFVDLRNELPGTVRSVHLPAGEVVEAGTLLVELDTEVEAAELQAQKARLALTETMLRRMEKALESKAASELDVERAAAERDVAAAEVRRIEALIERKTIRAPFDARIGLSDVHEGQYLQGGTMLTTLQGVAASVDVDFAVPETVAAGLGTGGSVEVEVGDGERLHAVVVAVDARFDPATRNAPIRARIEQAEKAPPPGASVRVHVPVGPPVDVLAIPANALRRGPSGNSVFVLREDGDGALRAHVRPVRTVGLERGEILVADGLEEGERIAASGSFKLREGALVVLAGAGGGDGAEAGGADSGAGGAASGGDGASGSDGARLRDGSVGGPGGG